MKAKIYHNPHCSKSRATLALLEARAVPLEVVHYLDTPPDAAELSALLTLLGLTARDIVRRNEAEFLDSGLGSQASNQELLALMLAHPKLIERPIVVYGDRARIGRPPENVLELFE